MIKGIQLREGVLTLVITRARSSTPCQSEGSVKFNFGEGGAIAEIHRGELMHFLYSVHSENPHEICDLIFKLIGTETRVCRIHFDLFDGPREGLQGSTAPDVLIDLASGTAEGAGGEEQVTFSLG
jgi:hypothetical protein